MKHLKKNIIVAVGIFILTISAYANHTQCVQGTIYVKDGSADCKKNGICVDSTPACKWNVTPQSCQKGGSGCDTSTCKDILTPIMWCIAGGMGCACEGTTAG